jgi:hypothetical protein
MGKNEDVSLKGIQEYYIIIYFYNNPINSKVRNRPINNARDTQTHEFWGEKCKWAISKHLERYVQKIIIHNI